MDYRNIDRTNKKNKWTVMKYVSDFSLLLDYADLIRKLNFKVDEDTIESINQKMKDVKLYKPKNGKPSIDTTSFKICQIVYSMIAYRSKDRSKIIYSPLGNLLIDNRADEVMLGKIYATMLMNLPYNHPYNKMDDSFNLFPYRVIFKLLLDSRLNNRIYADEMFYLIMWTKDIDDDSYDFLVSNILEFRTLSKVYKFEEFTKRLPLQDALANALHETEYLFDQMYSSNIVEHYDKDDVHKIGTLNHGGFGRNKIPESLNELTPEQLAAYKPQGRRSYYSDYITLKPYIKQYITQILQQCPYDEKPHSILEEMGIDDYILHLYNFYPQLLLQEIGISVVRQEKLSAILTLTNNINDYAHNYNKGDCYKFEDALTEAFNEFEDVSATKIGHAGNADVECIYLTINQKFDVEAKSTNKKLTAINSGRLASHRAKIGSKYTIVVTPNYVPSVAIDIKGTDNVILTANTFSSYLYQSFIKKTQISYTPIFDIIQENKGKDISPLVNEYISFNFGIGK